MTFFKAVKITVFNTCSIPVRNIKLTRQIHYSRMRVLRCQSGEMVDTVDSKSTAFAGMAVRVRPLVPFVIIPS